MNHHQRSVVAVGLACMVLVAAAAGQALAQAGAALPRPVMPTDMKQVTTIDTAVGTEIDKIVQDYFQKMMTGDGDVQKAAREAIVADAKAGAVDASAAYVARYAQAISAAVGSPVFASATNVRAKFNAALAVAKVAEITKSTKLEPAVLILLEDKQHYVVKMTALKAARAILPQLAKANAQQKLAQRIVAVAKAHASGAMTSEAYEALKDKSTIDAMLDLLAFRVSLYYKGVPEDPNADAIPFLFFQSFWGAEPSEQQKIRTFESAYQLLMLAAYQGDAQPTGTSLREQLAYVVEKVAQSLSVIATKGARLPGLEAEAAKLGKLAQSTSSTLFPTVKQVCEEIKKRPGCEKIQDPKLDPPPPTTQIAL